MLSSLETGRRKMMIPVMLINEGVKITERLEKSKLTSVRNGKIVRKDTFLYVWKIHLYLLLLYEIIITQKDKSEATSLGLCLQSEAETLINSMFPLFGNKNKRETGIEVAIAPQTQ